MHTFIHLPNSPNFAETYDALLKRFCPSLVLAPPVSTVSTNLRTLYNRGTCITNTWYRYNSLLSTRTGYKDYGLNTRVGLDT